MVGTPVQEPEIRRLPICSDLTSDALDEAIRLTGDPEAHIYRMTLICSRTQMGLLEMICADGRDQKMPTVVFVPDELMKNSDNWALLGERVHVVEDRW